jgi:hypothetical protein
MSPLRYEDSNLIPKSYHLKFEAKVHPGRAQVARPGALFAAGCVVAAPE